MTTGFQLAVRNSQFAERFGSSRICFCIFSKNCESLKSNTSWIFRVIHWTSYIVVILSLINTPCWITTWFHRDSWYILVQISSKNFAFFIKWFANPKIFSPAAALFPCYAGNFLRIDFHLLIETLDKIRVNCFNYINSNVNQPFTFFVCIDQYT